MIPGANFGTPFRVTATGALCVTSANAYILAVTFQGTATNIARLWVGATATGTGAATHLGRLVANSTTGVSANPATTMWFPAYCSGGFCVSNNGTTDGSLDPSITIFWNPAGGP